MKQNTVLARLRGRTSAPRAPKAPAPAHRGYDRPDGGYATAPSIVGYQATTRQVCGLYPFGHASASPLVSAPLGVHDTTLEPFGIDPFGLFDVGAIGNPSLFILGNPSIGKSTLVRRMIVGVLATGTNVLVLGDRKNEYTDLIELCDGEVIHLGPGRGVLNILDPGDVTEALTMLAAARTAAAAAGQDERAERLEEIYDHLLMDMHNRRAAMMTALIEAYRSARVESTEETIVDVALRWLHDNHDGVPTIADLLRVVQMGPSEVRAVALDRGSQERYLDATEGLEASLTGLCSGGGIGAMFNGQSTARIPRDRSVSFDLRGIGVSERAKLGAAYLATWSAGFGVINVAHALADAGLARRQRFLTVQDELWQALSTGPGAVDRSDEMGRLNREHGAGNLLITHTYADFNAIREAESRAKARGFVDRAGGIIFAGLSRDELIEFHSHRLSKVEMDKIVSWNAPAPLNRDGTIGIRPGRGKFMLKLDGETPGIPFRCVVPDAEHEAGIHDTNKRIRKSQEAAA